MNILEIAGLDERVPPQKYGGAELVISAITERLVKKGHDVTLLATGNSQTKAKLVPILPEPIRELHPTDTEQWQQYLKVIIVPDILKAIRDTRPDIIHNHISWRMIVLEKILPCPMVSTIHGPITSFNDRQTFGRFPNHRYVSISNNQRKAMPEIRWLSTIYNGIDVSSFTYTEKKDDYFAFLGRISPEKGLKEICLLIKKTKHKLKIAAKIDYTDVAFYKKEIMPLIDGEQIEFVGEVDHHGKNKLLRNARALLLWLNWEEPFGLVVIEANACGTPVIVNRRGAMMELIEHGKNGILVDTLLEMKNALEHVHKISTNACRTYVEKRFSADIMTDRYEELFKTIIKDDD
ncbi:glycosyltransferase family 4 protein [Candidatus Parcubacteria bacterium]|nr:glycosyltransferase family 4 protein [Candidatus Parcubacteria bacterium]